MTVESRSWCLEVEWLGTTAVVRFPDAEPVHLGDLNSEHLRELLAAVAAAPGCAEIVADFRNVQSVTSTTLAALVTLHQRMRAADQRLVLCNLDEPVYEVFAVTRLDLLLAVHRATGAGILVVDDEPAVRAVVSAALHRGGYRVWAVAGGAEALALLRGRPGAIDLALLDVTMPAWDGPRTLAELRRVRPDLRCCFMTAGSARYSASALRDLGALHVFAKPFALDEVVQMVGQLLGAPEPCPVRRN